MDGQNIMNAFSSSDGLFVTVAIIVVIGLLVLVSRRKLKKNKYHDKIVSIVQHSGTITNEQIARRLEISNASATRYLKRLEKDDVLKNVGSERGVLTYIIK